MNETYPLDAPPIGIVTKITIVTHCPGCGAEFGPENLATLRSQAEGLRCGPCIGEEPRR